MIEVLYCLNLKSHCRGVVSIKTTCWTHEPYIHYLQSLYRHLLWVAPALMKAAAAPAVGTGTWSTRAFMLGITLFSGSLYSLVLTGDKRFGAIAPIGGTSLIAGWVLLAMRL